MKNTLHFTFLRALMVLAFGLFFNGAWGQTSVQNFGTDTSSYSSQTGSASAIVNPSVGTTYARAGAGSSSIAVLNTDNPLSGTGSYLKASASTSTSIAKVSPILGYTQSNEFYTSFKIMFAGATPTATASNGTWTFYQGTGAMYSNNNDFTGSQIFTGIRFTYSSNSNGIVNLEARQGGSWSDAGLATSLPQKSALKIEIVGNNKSSETISYSYNGVNQTVAAGKYDLYVDGVLIGNDILSGQISANANISSTTFIGASSTSNSANIYMDDFVVYNAVPSAIGNAPTSTTWNGTAWSNQAPTSTIDAIIAGDYNTGANGAITAKSLTVNSGIFTVESGSLASVQGAITNNAGAANFIVKSGGHLIQTDAAANVNAITVERNSAPIVRLDHTLWSSPVASQNLFAFSPNTLTNRFYTYDAATNTFINTGLSSASTFVTGKGYGVRAPNNHPTTAAEWLGTFSGVPNNGNQTFALSLAGTGFNLVGNPYPSAINATTFTNAANNPHINGTIYFYAHSLTMNADGTFPAGTNYTTWNATGHTLATGASVIPNGTIQVGQGFIVKAVSAGDVTFTNAMRTAGTTQFFRTSNAYTSNSEVEKHRIWLDLTNTDGSAFNQILIGYVAGATEGIDRNFDGLSFGNTGSSLATKIDGQDFAIQARSLPFQASDVVPLTLKITTAGSYTITLSNLDGLFAGDQGVFLKDNVTGVTHDIKASPYTFNATVGTFNNRFEVVYNTTLSTPESNLTPNSIVAFKRANVLNVESKNIEMASIKVYDVQGRLVYSKSGINSNTTVLSDLQVQNGVLLLQVTSTEGETATIKVIN